MDGSEEEQEGRYFPIISVYAEIFDRLTASCDLLLSRSDLLPKDICCIGRLKYALSRIPLCTEGLCISVSLTYVTDAEGSWAGQSLDLSKDRLDLSDIGYVRGPFGGDSDCRTTFSCESSGYRADVGEDPFDVLNELKTWLQTWETACNDVDMEFNIRDEENEFDWDQPDDEEAWDNVPVN